MEGIVVYLGMGKSEDRLQQEIYLWFHNDYPQYRGLLFHVPNGGLRSGREAKKLKSMGVVPGVADLLLMFRGATYCIELKTLTGTQSPNQKKWQALVESHGFDYYIVRTLSEAQKLIEIIIN